MDKKKSLLNVSFSIIFKIVLLVLSIVVKRFLIKYAGNDINGLNTLFLGIIGILSVAELGIGTAISFCMYAPIVKKEYKKVSALYNLFRKSYLIIGATIFGVGCLLLPFLKYFAKGYESVSVSLQLTFFLMLVSTVLSYANGAKLSLINAYKDNYVTTIISSGGHVFCYVIQVVALVVTHSFVYYVLCKVITAVFEIIVTEVVFNRKYNHNLKKSDRLEAEEKKEVAKNVKAMFMHKLGAVLVNSFDSLIISTFLGVTILGKYSNYSAIIASLQAILMLFFTPLTSVIGHLFVEEDKKAVKSYFKFFYGVNFCLGYVFFLGYYAIIDDLVRLFFGYNLELSNGIVYVITANYFIQFMRQSVLLFRDATGTFYNDRWKILFEGILNIILSVSMVLILPEEYKVVGVIVATIITNLLICHVVEPYVLFKNGFGFSPQKYYFANYISIACFLITMFLFSRIGISVENIYLRIVVRGCLSVAVAVIPCFAQILLNKDFRKHFAILGGKNVRKKS